ncbi:MAG: pilus assembly protein PilM [Planctomycetia bacterium]|jgi:hypothetical protein|nr:pilus assembly protein PilM [Planctomycetia bacterium]NCG12312.1 pilus assembly protein PilM [Planctomycetia bacterium]NCG56756.1 pilus assembly protein PilM [Pseudomonadota bacterium]
MSYKGQATVIQKTGKGWRALQVSGSDASVEIVRSRESHDHPELGDFLKAILEEGFGRDNVVLALDSDSSSLRYHGVPPVPAWRLELILRYELEEVAEKTGEQLSGGHIELQVPESTSDDTLLLLGMGKDRIIQPLIDEVSSKGGRARHAVPGSIGVYHAHMISSHLRDEETVMLADIGETETQILLVAGDRLLFARSVGFGVIQFSESVQDRCSVSEREAADLMQSFADGDLVSHEDTVSQCYRGWLSQLSQMLGSSVNFCQAQLKMGEVSAHRLRLSGVGSSLASMSDELERSLSVQVESVSIAGTPDSSWSLIAGVGASVLDKEERFVDLLPEEERKKKTFREKTIFLYGAMVCFLITLGAQFLDSSIAGGRAESAGSVISSWQGKIAGWNVAEDQARKENDVLRKREVRLLEEVETGRFYARILDGLREQLPQEVSVDLVVLRRQSGEDSLGIELQLEGRSDDSGRRGVDAIDELRNVLESLQGVQRVKADLQDIKNGSYPFQIVVSPDESLPDKNTRSRSRSSRPRSPFERN